MVDNVVRAGKTAVPTYTDPDCEAVRGLLRYIQSSPHVDAVTAPTVGPKGWDGFIYAYRK